MVTGLRVFSKSFFKKWFWVYRVRPCRLYWGPSYRVCLGFLGLTGFVGARFFLKVRPFCSERRRVLLGPTDVAGKKVDPISSIGQPPLPPDEVGAGLLTWGDGRRLTDFWRDLGVGVDGWLMFRAFSRPLKIGKCRKGAKMLATQVDLGAIKEFDQVKLYGHFPCKTWLDFF